MANVSFTLLHSRDLLVYVDNVPHFMKRSTYENKVYQHFHENLRGKLNKPGNTVVVADFKNLVSTILKGEK